MTPLRHVLTTARAVILFVGTLTAAYGPVVTCAAPRPPNIVMIFIDDLGWRDVGFMGNQFIETPNLDRLARNGLVFDQAYASAPNCAPTRAWTASLAPSYISVASRLSRCAPRCTFALCRS